MAQRAVFYTKSSQGELWEMPGVSATPVRFSALRALEPLDQEALDFLSHVARSLATTSGGIAVYGHHQSLSALLGLAPALRKRLCCRIVDHTGESCPVLPELAACLPEELPREVGTVYFNLPGTARAHALRKRLPAGLAVVSPEQMAGDRPEYVPLRAWVPARECLYPIDIPEIRIPSGLDVLLVDSLAKNMGFMPNGIGYVHNILKRTGLKCATFDLDIVAYHRFHTCRLLDAPWALLTPQGQPVPDDPWRAELGGLWQQEDFLRFFAKDMEEFCTALRQAAPKIVGFTVHEANSLCVSKLAERVRRDLPDTLIIAGGYSCLDPTFAHAALPIADYTVVGEADMVLGPLVQRLIRGERPGDIPGVISRFDQQGRQITTAEPAQDLDALDLPTYEWFGPGLYRNHNGYQLIPITKSRGCRWARCTFCTERFLWRTRSAKSVADELEWHYRQGGDQFLFNDSDFNADREVMLALCEEIERRNLRIRLTGQLRIDRHNTAEYLKKLRKAGFVSLHFGVDAWSKRSLVTARKGYTVPIILENLKACHEAGLFCEINLIVAYPGETEEDVDETIANIVEAKPYIGRIAVINPLLMKTGCLFWEKSEEYGIQFIADKNELARQYPTGIPSYFWHATNPLLDEERRNARVYRVVKALEQHGIPIGEVASASLDDMETGQDALRGSQRFGLSRRVVGRPEQHSSRSGQHLLHSGGRQYVLDQAGLETVCGALGLAPKAKSLNAALKGRELGICEAIEPSSLLLVSEGVHDYNIIQLGVRFAAIRQGVPFDPLRFATGGYGPQECILGESVVGLVQHLEEAARSLNLGARSDCVRGDGMAALKRITVITVVRNAVSSLEKTLQSVFIQEGVEVEHIVVDGRSTDGTTELLLRHRERFAHLLIAADSGPTEALNKALPLATGEFVGFLLDGDWYEPGALARVAELGTGADVLCGRMANWIDGRPAYISHPSLERMRLEMSINFPATFIRGELAKSIGNFEQSFDIATDYDFLLRCYLFGAKFRKVDFVLANMSLDGRSAKHWARGYWHAAKSKIRHTGAPVASLCYCVYQLARTSTRVALCWLKLDFVVRVYRLRMASIRKTTMQEGSLMPSVRSFLSEKGEKVLHYLRARLSARTKRRLRNFLGLFGWRQQRPLLHLYPIDIPEIEIKPGLDFLLLELPPRYMPMMPNGLAYVDLILRNSGVAHQTIDTNIIMYHRFHQARLLHDAKPVLPSGRPAPEDPWDNTLEAEWHAVDFIEFFWPQLQEILDKIVAARPKAVGISLNGFNRRLADRFIAALREAAPDILIVVGGYDCVYANVGPRLFKNYDYMIIGEGENSMPPLLDAIREGRRPGNLPGIFSAYDMPGTPFAPCELPQNLDLDSPRYAWVSHALYQTYGRLHMVPLTASRGCNWGKCRFCAECFSFRKRSPRHVADEIEYWTKLGFHTFHFNESDVNGDHANLHGICTEIIDRGLSISCVGQLRIDRRNTPEYFKHLARAGFKHLRFGVDGWSRNTLKLQCKGYVTETVHANIKACAAAGIRTTVNIVIGVPGETDADVTESIGHIRALKENIDEVESLNTLILAAGSEYMKNPDKYHIKFRGNKDEILAEHPYFIPSELWYSEGPYIDQTVRMERLSRICLELDASGVAIGPFARKIVERLKGVADAAK